MTKLPSIDLHTLATVTGGTQIDDQTAKELGQTWQPPPVLSTEPVPGRKSRPDVIMN